MFQWRRCGAGGGADANVMADGSYSRGGDSGGTPLRAASASHQSSPTLEVTSVTSLVSFVLATANQHRNLVCRIARGNL